MSVAPYMLQQIAEYHREQGETEEYNKAMEAIEAIEKVGAALSGPPQPTSASTNPQTKVQKMPVEDSPQKVSSATKSLKTKVQTS